MLYRFSSCVGLLAALLLVPPCVTGLGEDNDTPRARVEVSISKLRYSPANAVIHVGDTVVWINNDDRDHTVVAGDGTFKSLNIKSGQSFEFTFTRPGKCEYGCGYHPRMCGTITVEGNVK